MDNKSEKHHYTYRVVGEEVTVAISREEEPALSNAVKQLNQLWEYWMRRKRSTDSDYFILARVALQFAKLYYDEIERSKKREEDLRRFLQEYERKMDNIFPQE